MAKTKRSSARQTASKKTQYSAKLQKAEMILDYYFNDKNLLLLALTHPSASEGSTTGSSYERLEFLGDAILGAIISRELYDTYPGLDEGALTRLKVSVVAGSTLAKLADELGLGSLIIFGSSERGTGKRGLQSALENVYEALVAAILLDGGMDEAKRFVLRTLAPKVNTAAACEPENPKSLLQEMLQTQRITPKYEIIDTEGPPHNRVFTANVLSDDQILATGTGHSKKDAEIDAAAKALDALNYPKSEDDDVRTEQKR